MEENAILPVKLASPARRALANAGITTLKQLSKFTEHEIAGFHGIGQNAITAIKKALLENGMSFSKDKTQKNN